MQSTSTTSDSTNLTQLPCPAEKEPPYVYRVLYQVVWRNGASPIVQVQDFEELPTENEIFTFGKKFEKMFAQTGLKVKSITHFATIKHYYPSKAASNALQLEADSLELE